MAQVVRELRETSVQNTEDVSRDVNRSDSDHQSNVAERVIYYIGGIIMGLIALRIILSLLGANRANGFASFIYGVSYPFVAPFFGLFNYRMQYGVSRFEFESLVALIVWGMVTAAIARLVTITRRA